MKRIAAVVVLGLVSLPLMAMRGAVYSARGKVANAKVEAYSMADRVAAVDRLLDGKWPVPLATATTDESGAFSLDAKTDAAVWVRVTAPGFQPATSLLFAKADDVVISLDPAADKSGVVRSQSKPVAGAKVFVFGDMFDVAAVYETDEQGRFSMPDPLRWAYGICVQHPSYAIECRTRNEERVKPVSLDFTLVPGTVATGRVITAAGKPVANARVAADFLTRTTTAEDGTFKIRLRPANKRLRAITSGMTGSAAVGNGAVTITMEPGRTIAGTVRDEKGRAVAGARVLAQSDDGESWPSVVVNAKGEFTLEPLASARYALYVYTPEELEVEAKEIDLRKKTSARADFSATAVNAVRGIVRDDGRQPVAGATVMHLSEDSPVVYGTALGYARTVSGPDGRFRIHAPPGGRFAAIKAGYAAGVSEKLDSKSAGKDVVISLPSGIAVSGVVVASDGKPVPDAGLLVMAGASTVGLIPMASSLASGVVEPWVRTDEHGAFTVRLNPGVHDFGVWKKGFAGRDVGNVQVGESPEPMHVVLDAAVEIRGRVAFKGRRPAGEIAVYAIQESQRSFGIGAVAEDGSFAIGSLEPGVYTLRLTNARGIRTKTVTAPAKDVVLDAAETVEITGKVTDKSTGAPIPRFEVSVQTDEDFVDSEEIDDPNGQFVQAVPAGLVQLSVTAPGYVEGTLNVTASAKSDPVTLALTRGRRVAGRVTATDGRPLAEVAVGIEESSHPGTMSDEDGEYAIDGAPAEALKLTFTKEGFLSAHKVIPAGSTDQHVDAALSSGLKISGRVVDKSGAPVEGAHVNAVSDDEDAEYQGTTTDKSGLFTIEGLSAAKYSFRAAKAQVGQAKQEDVDVTKPQNLLLTLGSDPTGTIHGTVTGAANGGWLIAMVMVTSDSGGSATGRVGRDGKFVVENAPAGDVRVRGSMMSADRQSSTKVVRTVVPAGGDVEVQLAASGDVNVRGIVRSAGEPVPGAAVTFWSENDGQWQSRTGMDGAYEIAAIEPGHYRVSVSRPEGGTYSTELDAVSSTTFDINMEFAQIAGRVIDDRGAGVEGAKVKLVSPGGHSYSDPERNTDVSGAFAFTVQGGSDHRVSAVKHGYVVSYADVPDGSTTPVILQLHRGNGARVRLVDSRDGSTLNGFVVVRDETGRVQIPISGDHQPDGSLLLALPEGNYRVSASANEYASNTIAMSVPAPDATIPLSRGGTLIVQSDERASELIRLVMPNGDEYVRCYCNGIAEIRLTGALTKVDHVAPGSYRMDVVDTHGATRHSYPITIAEGQTTTVDATK